MKNRNLLILGFLLLFTISASDIEAQVPSYIFAGGTSNNSFPFNSTTSNKVQWVYLPTDFTPNLQAGLITHVYFKSNNSANVSRQFTDYRISIGHTNISTFSNGTFITGLTVHYSQTVTINVPSTGWIGVELTTPFSYDGTSNLIVEATITNTSGATMAQSSVGGNKRIWGLRTNTSGSTGSGLTGCGFEIVTCSTAINQQPVSKTVCENQQASFSITSTDATVFKWQVDEGTGFTDVVNGANYAGATTTTLDVKNTPFGFDGYQYRCLVFKGTSTSCTDTSDTVSLNVNGLVSVEDLKQKDTTCIAATKDLEAKAEGSITGYRWQMFIAGEGFVDIPQQPPFIHMGEKLQIAGVPDTLDGTRFRCLVDGICDSTVSSELLLTVSTVPKVAVPPADVVADQGDDVQFEVQVSAAGARYQWQVAAPDTFVNINDGGIYQGVKTNRLYVRGVSRVQDNFKFRCVVRSGPECNAPGDTSDFGLLNVNPAVSVGSVANNDLMVLYPNPVSSGDLFIQAKGKLAGTELKYKVTDKTGRTIMLGNMNPHDKTRIDVGRLSSDIYIVEIMGEGNETVGKSRFTKL